MLIFSRSKYINMIYWFLEKKRFYYFYSLIIGDNTDLPSYKELFPSHPDISNIGNDPSSSLPPPSYDDFVKTLGTRQSTTSLPRFQTVLPIESISLPTTNLPTSSTQSQTSPTRCIWITHRTQRPAFIRGTVTYV